MPTRRLEFFLTPSDEKLLLERIRTRFPWFVVLEQRQRAFHVSPELADPVQVWLPTAPVDEADLAPDKLPRLIQFLRCKPRSSFIFQGKLELCIGGLAIIYEQDDERTAASVRAVWSLTKKLCTSAVVSYNPIAGLSHGRVKGIWLGPEAAAWSRSGGWLHGNAANIYYAPADQYFE